MPIYEFLCGLCSKNYEIISLRVEETISTLCPYCNGEGQKLISAPAIVY
jgi:putative FmdB family regulatory protein